MSDYNIYYYNSKKGILFNKLFYYMNYDKSHNLDNKLNNIIKKNLIILKNNIIYCKNYNNKEYNMGENDIHWEFTDFIINTAKYHRLIDNTIESNEEINIIRENIVIEIERAISLGGELILYILDILNNLKKLSNNDKLFYIYINNNISTIILKKIINEKDLNIKINPFIERVIYQYNILFNNEIHKHLIIFVKFITNIILTKIKNIYFYKNNDELNNSINIECSVSNIIHYMKKHKNIIVGIFMKHIKNNIKVEHKYNNLNSINSQRLYDNIYKKWDIIPDHIKNFYRNFITILDINRNVIINENNYSNITTFKNKRFNFKKNQIGDKITKFNDIIPKINNNIPYKIWYTDENNIRSYIEINDYYTNEDILNNIYNKIYLYNKKSDNIIIDINNNEILLKNDIVLDNNKFTININKILKKIFHIIDNNNRYSTDITIIDTVKKHSLILSFINRELDLFLFLLYNYNIKNTKEDIESIHPYTCFKILQNYNVELYSDGNIIKLEDVSSWNNHYNHYNNKYNENLLDIKELRHKSIFINYFQLLIDYVNNNLKLNKINKKNIRIKYVNKLEDIKIINNDNVQINLSNRLNYLKKKTVASINIIQRMNECEYNYDITYSNIFLINKKLVELDINNNYGYFENLIINLFLETNKYKLNINEEKIIYINLNKMDNLKEIINNLNISLILFLKFTELFDYNKTILNIKNFNFILKTKILNIMNYYAIKLDIINIFLNNIETRLALSNTV
jgi:hypothetical protein